MPSQVTKEKNISLNDVQKDKDIEHCISYINGYFSIKSYIFVL